MMSSPLLRSMINQFDRRAAYLAVSHVPHLAGDMQSAAGAEPLAVASLFARWSADAVTHYGLDPSPSQASKAFAYSGGVAVVPVHGVLLNRFAGSWGIVTGYSAIRSQMQAAVSDPDVRAIVLDVNSPGGMCAGCRELSDDIYAARRKKPILAVIDHQGTSAAYMLASAASKVVATPTGDVGSIGVVAMHVSLAGALEAEGIKVTMIHAGAHKVDGHPYEDLSDEVRADIQRDVDAHYETFVSAVARNRGISAKAVRDTEAQVYRASEALSLGLIDSMEPPSKALASFLAGLPGNSSTAKGTKRMSTQQEPETPAVVVAPIVDAAAVSKAERIRIQGILGSDAAKGRRALAEHLALETDMTAEAATKILAKSPQEPAPAATAEPSAFVKAMNAGKHPDISAEETGGEADKPSRGKMALDALLGPEKRVTN